MPDDDRRLVLGALMPGVRGPAPEPWLVTALADGVESVCLFGEAVGTPERVRTTTAALRAQAPDLLVSLDEESGEVTRVQAVDGSSFLSALALGAIDDPEVTRASARLLASLLADVGVDWTLAPVVDVNVDPRNPVIGVRSFGADAALVARQAAAMITGLQESGVAACAKHFPGHGDTHVDSHESLPVLSAGLGTLEDRELVPFRSAIAGKVASVMTGHLLVPTMDPDAPASLSETVTRGWLRDRLGFLGVIVTDAIEMGAVSGPGRAGLGAAAVAALRAGADVVCIGADDQERALSVCVESVLAALDEGGVEGVVLGGAGGRRAELRNGRGLRTAGHGRAEDERTVAAAARRSVAVTGDPMLHSAAVDVTRISAHPGYAAGETGWGVAEPLAAAGLDVQTVDWKTASGGDGYRALVIEVRDAWKDPDLQDRLAGLLASRRDAVVVDVGWPQPVDDRAAGWVATRGTGRLSSALAACLLTGRDPEPAALAVLRAARVEMT
jgi:beta-N-acetylhexosaminidase